MERLAVTRLSDRTGCHASRDEAAQKGSCSPRRQSTHKGPHGRGKTNPGCRAQSHVAAFHFAFAQEGCHPQQTSQAWPCLARAKTQPCAGRSTGTKTNLKMSDCGSDQLFQTNFFLVPTYFLFPFTVFSPSLAPFFAKRERTARLLTAPLPFIRLS